MSVHTAWTGMLAPEHLAALETANGTAGLDGAKPLDVYFVR